MVYVFLGLSALFAGVFGAAAGWFDTWNALWQLPLGIVCCFVCLFLVLSVVIILSAMVFKLMSTPQKPSRYFRFLADTFCQLALPILGVRLHVTGTEKVPTNGRFMLVANHLCIYDPIVMLCTLPGRTFSFISKQENEKLFVVSDFLRALLCLSIDRNNDRAALRTIIKAIELIREDRTSIAVFPEGGTSKDGKLAPMRSGVFKIAQKTQVPIVVCVLNGTKQINKNVFRRRTDVTFDVLQVISAEEYADLTTVDIGNRVHEIMAQALAEQEKKEET